MERFANNADSTLNGAINDSTTTIIVVDGSPFPSIGDFRLLLGSDADTGEIVLATARSSNTITVVRGQEGTTAQSWIDGTTVTHILTAGATESLRDTLKGKTLNSTLETISTSEDGYALTWVNTDGYWAARPGSPFAISGNELNSTRSLSIDSNGTFASAHGDGSPKLYVNGTVLASKFSSGEIPLTVQRFGYLSDAFQTFTVPDNVTSVQVKVWGPGGGSGNYSSSGGAGPGGFSTGILSVTPGETLYIAVGSGGKKPVSTTGNGGLGGWPGGGFGTRGDASGGGGGGLSGIFSANTLVQANALMIAGGGGGSTGFGNFGAGGGGGLVGGGGTVGSSGFGGTQSAGGNNSNNTATPSYTAGSALQGGTAFTDNTTSQSNDCGGGGSGYFGGGAGQSDGRAGGGGSGFLHATRVSNGVTTTGSNAAVGSGSNAPPSTTDPYYISGTGVGAAASGTGNDGGDGYVVVIYGGQTSIDETSITLNNGASVTTSNLDVVIKSDGYIKLQATNLHGQVGSDLITLSSATSGIKLDVNSVAVGRIFQSGAWAIGNATNNDTSTEAQSGLTGTLINLSSGSGSFTSTANQALIFNQSGAINLQGHTEVRFNTGTTLKGYFDSNGIFRIGPSAVSGTTLHGASSPFVGSDYLYMYNASGSAWAEIISGLTNTRAALQVLNNGAGGSATCGVALFAAGTSHATAEYTGNGIIEQSGASTSGLIFTKLLGNGTGFASTGAIWQSGAWTIGRSTQNDTSSEAQAGLTGPLLNLTQITGGTQTSVANQSLLYNTAGTITLQGHVGHSFVANTTTVASTSTTKFITNIGIRTATNVRTTSYLVTASDHVIIVGTLSSSITITLPASPTAGDTYIIKDQAGGSATNNIIVSGNGANIDGASTYTINTNYQSITVVFANGTWSII